MDTTDPQIQFYENGYCNHCTGLLALFNQPRYKREFNEQGFERLIEKIKRAGKNKRYDCVVGISGGVDSAYLAYLLRQNGLRILLVHMDNGWNSEEAVRNIKSVADSLQADYEAFVLDWEEFRDLQRSFLKASVVEAETPTDMAIVSVLHKIAARHGVGYVASGGNLATEGILPCDWHYDAKDLKYLHSIQRLFGTKKLKHFPTFGFWEEVWYKFFKKIKIVYPLNYFSFSKEEAVNILTSQMKWRNYGAKHYESRYTKFIQGYLLPKKFDIDYRKATFSSQICSGSLTREDALVKLHLPLYHEDEMEREKKFISKKLALDFAELEHIISQPAKTYRDYPNNKGKLDFLYKLYRKIFNSVYKGSLVSTILFLPDF
jgi:N-acetyl sugar amidotransferase